MDSYLERISDKVLKRSLKGHGAVLIEGPKWCGKTTSAIKHCNSKLFLSNINQYMKAKALLDIDVRQVLKGEPPLLIVEWQFIPELWDSIRFEIDMRQSVGQFILTGSTIPFDKSQLHHSGTGRIDKLQMRPMSLFESKDSTGEVSLSDLFCQKQITADDTHTLNEIAFLICRGGWPTTIFQDPEIALHTAFSYIDSVASSDISSVAGVPNNKLRLMRIFKSYARNIATQAPIETIRQDVMNQGESTFSQTALYSYINSLNNLFVIEDTEAWNPNFRSKVAIRNKPTRYFVDPSIATAALEMGPNDLMNDMRTFGLIFENLCVRDLRVYSQELGGVVQHYRDSSGLECDCVLHCLNGEYALIEVKVGGEKAIEEGAKNLLKLRDKIKDSKIKEPAFMMVLCAVSSYAIRRSDGVYVVPIGALKP